MLKKRPHITVFEYESLRVDRGIQRLAHYQLEALQQFYGEKGTPYYSLIHNGIKFCQYVGVIQVGNLVIEILPKADKNGSENKWRKVLIEMLYAVGVFDIYAPSSSSLRLKANSILDLYFELYIQELEYLIHKGLIKRYRKTEGNSSTLKGSIHFAKHIRKNLTHQERFYINYTTYDKEHILHSILYKALKLLGQINTNVNLNSRLGSLMLDFPEMKDIRVSEMTFDRIILDRKTKPYDKAIQIARLILLNYHPDIKKGTNSVLALMFDMNLLWEKFVYASLKKKMASTGQITAQNVRNFWKPTKGYNSKIKPDIVIDKDKGSCVVLDTKWKNIAENNPSPQDLRQMFVYMKYYNAKRVALVYPGTTSRISSGTYFNHENNTIGDEECSVIKSVVEEDIKAWQANILNQILKWSNS